MREKDKDVVREYYLNLILVEATKGNLAAPITQEHIDEAPKKSNGKALHFQHVATDLRELNYTVEGASPPHPVRLRRKDYTAPKEAIRRHSLANGLSQLSARALRERPKRSGAAKSALLCAHSAWRSR